jgi:hypothetical protein
LFFGRPNVQRLTFQRAQYLLFPSNIQPKAPQAMTGFGNTGGGVTIGRKSTLAIVSALHYNSAINYYLHL